MANKHTIEELRQRQSLPLEAKIQMTYARVKDWIDAFGEQGVCISFSGGKDSTVLLDLVRNRFGYSDVKAVFVDVPTQFPELRQFVKTFENVDTIKPKISFMEVCEKYGFPLISKEVSEAVWGARRYLEDLALKGELPTEVIGGGGEILARIPTSLRNREMAEQAGMPNSFGKCLERENIPREPRGGTSKDPSEQLADLLNERVLNRSGGQNIHLAKMLGWITKDKDHPIKANIPSRDKSRFSAERYKFFLNAPFEISNRCCGVMKKEPIYRYEKEHGVFGITAQMADESNLRMQKWLKTGCNAFEAKHPISNPMSFWTEDDVLEYIYINKLPICSVYGEVVPVDDQLTFDDMGFDTGDAPRKRYKTTGCKRTGCMMCGFGCHLEKYPSRFELLKQTHPGVYGLLDKCKNNGVTFREAIEWTNEHGNLKIRL